MDFIFAGKIDDSPRQNNFRQTSRISKYDFNILHHVLTGPSSHMSLTTKAPFPGPYPLAHTAIKIHNKSTIIDCKLFSQSHCGQLLYFPLSPHLCYNTRCTRNIVPLRLQSWIVNYFHDTFRTVVVFTMWFA